MSLRNSNIIHAACEMTPGAVPVFVKNRGFTGAVQNGVGDYTLTLSEEADQAESLVFVRGKAAIAASGLTAFGVARPTDATIRITCLNEGAAGIASALTDLQIEVLVIRLPTGN